MGFAINLLLMTPTRKLVGVFCFCQYVTVYVKEQTGVQIWNKIFWQHHNGFC